MQQSTFYNQNYLKTSTLRDDTASYKPENKDTTFLSQAQGKKKNSKRPSKPSSTRFSNVTYPRGTQKVIYLSKAKVDSSRLSDNDMNFDRSNNSAYSTMATLESDQDAELSGFKVVLDGKMLLTPKDSILEFSQVNSQKIQSKKFYACAKEFQNPSITKISLPNFILEEDSYNQAGNSYWKNIIKNFDLLNQ